MGLTDNQNEMRGVLLMLFALVFSLSSCSRVSSGPDENAFRDKTFVHRYFETEEDCLKAQPDPDFFVNCHQQVDFFSNNEVEIVLSDIIWRGDYIVEGDMVILSFQPNFEIPDGEINFEILNLSVLRKLDDNTRWVMMRANSIWK
ncbi:hypothetical protein [Salegentibacter chungangensis]|uniref:Lipoprotein n=1 Tax=Salegentibacter chungangensis TaxID=1335724 RepID=A0ABW3NQG0_9FLAO